MPKVTKPGKPSKPTTTPAPAPVITTQPPAPALGIPVGTIPTTLKIAYGRGKPWSRVTVDAPYHRKYGDPYGIAAMLMAMEVIEAGGEMIWNTGGSGAYGIMQIKELDWGWLAEEIGADLQTREGQIAVAAAILGYAGRGSTPRERFIESYYPVRDKQGRICLSCKGEDGSTPQQYLDDMDALVKIINAAASGTTPAVTTTPAPQAQGDVLDLLYGGRPHHVSAEYGQLVTWQCPTGVNPGQPGNCYEFQKAYGLDDRHHYAIDVSAETGDGAPLYAPCDGLIVCAGTGIGPGAWGTGCGANNRLNNYGGLAARAGAGRLELLRDDGQASLIIGHVLGSAVKAGDRVARGDLIGWQGGMNASHVHLEGRTKDGKIANPRQLVASGPIPVTYDAERIPLPDLSEWEVSETVTVTRDGVPLLQRASLTAPQVASPFEAGDTFEAVALALGNDHTWYWLTKRYTRIPISGTRSALLGDR